jgi:hypothetical protein
MISVIQTVLVPKELTVVNTVHGTELRASGLLGLYALRRASELLDEASEEMADALGR